MQTTVSGLKSHKCAGKRHRRDKNKKDKAGKPAENRAGATSQDEYAAPLVDIIEYENEFVIVADMPGVAEEGVDVNFNEGELTIFGAVEEADCCGDEEIVVRACQFNPNDYYRSFRVGESINSDAIRAEFQDGVLTVRLPKREEIQPRKIEINKKDA